MLFDATQPTAFTEDGSVLSLGPVGSAFSNGNSYGVGKPILCLEVSGRFGGGSCWTPPGI